MSEINNFLNTNFENYIIDNLKIDIDNKINRFVKNKSSVTSFQQYIDNLNDDYTKLNLFNTQLNNLSRSNNTLKKLFKSFTSQKRTSKIRHTIEEKSFTRVYTR